MLCSLTNSDLSCKKCNSDRELLSQAWMKPDKSVKAPHVLLVSKRFNEVCFIVVSSCNTVMLYI